MSSVPECTSLVGNTYERTSPADDDAELMQPCECCGLTEECTSDYVARVRGVFCGTYVCGLCSEAVKEGRARLESFSMEQALSAHMDVCARFNCSSRPDPLVQLAAMAGLMRQILRRSGSNAGSPSESPNRPCRAPLRSQSCITFKSTSSEFD